MPKKQKVRRMLELRDDEERVDTSVEQVQAVGGKLQNAILPEATAEARQIRKTALPNFRKKKDIHVNVNANNIRLVL